MKIKNLNNFKLNPSATIAEAKNHLSAIVHQAEKVGFVSLTRRGKITAYIVSSESFTKLTRTKTSFYNNAKSIIDRIDKEFLLSDSEIHSWRDNTPGRKFKL